MYTYTYRHTCKYRKHMYVCVSVYIPGPSRGVIEHRFMCSTHREAKRYQNFRVWSRERLTAGPCKRHRANAPKTKFFKIFQQSIFKERLGRGRWVRVMVGCCKLLGIVICSCGCPPRSGNDVPVNFQRDKCSATFYLYMNGKVLYI